MAVEMRTLGADRAARVVRGNRRAADLQNILGLDSTTYFRRSERVKESTSDS